MARPKDTKKDRHPIMDEEYQKILFITKMDKSMYKATKLKLLRAYTILFHSGCRVSEIVDFTKDDLSYIITNKNYVLTKTKTKTTQMLKFNDTSVNVFNKLDLSDVDNYLFYTNGKDKAMTKDGLTHLINKHLKSQLNQLFTTHSFRSGYVTRIVEATGNISVAQKLARHSDPKTTLKYISATNRQIDDALDKIFK